MKYSDSVRSTLLAAIDQLAAHPENTQTGLAPTLRTTGRLQKLKF